MHYSIFTIHYALCSIYYVLYTMHYALCTMHYALYTMHYALCIVHYVLCTMHYSLFDIHYALCTMHYALFNIHYALCTIHYLLFKLPLIILSPPPLSLIAKVPQFFENFTILSFTMALGAHMRPYSYIYCAPYRDGMLQAPNFQGEHYGRQLHIVCGVILLMILQLMGTISYHSPGLHQNTSQSDPRGITIHCVPMSPDRDYQDRS